MAVASHKRLKRPHLVQPRRVGLQPFDFGSDAFLGPRLDRLGYLQIAEFALREHNQIEGVCRQSLVAVSLITLRSLRLKERGDPILVLSLEVEHQPRSTLRCDKLNVSEGCTCVLKLPRAALVIDEFRDLSCVGAAAADVKPIRLGAEVYSPGMRGTVGARLLLSRNRAAACPAS